MTGSITPTFQGEVQLRRWSESSTQGVQVTFALAESADLNKFKGLDGKRFIAVLVQIGDDEQPVSADSSAQKQSANSRAAREPLGDLCWRAVQWCKDPEFWSWVNSTTHSGVMWHVKSEDDAREFVCEMCEVGSRKELDTNPAARTAFNQYIRGPYHKHLIARGLA